MRKALVNAVADGTVVVKRRKHFLHAGENLIDPHHIEVRFLLTSKGGVRQVFCGRGRTHGDRDFFLTVLQPIVELTNFFFEFRREGRFFHPTADFGTGFGKRMHVFNVKTFETLGDTRFKTAFLNEKPERFSRRREAVGHTDTRRRELAEKFAQRRILAADAVNVSHAQLAEGKNITALNHLILVL